MSSCGLDIVVTARLTVKTPGNVIPLSKTLLFWEYIFSVTVDSFEKDRKCFVVYGQCLFS